MRLFSLEIVAMSLQPGVYRHYKGPLYQVIQIASHSETDERLVVYRCLYGDCSWWVRPLAMFAGPVSIAGEEVPRFQWLKPFRAGDFPGVPPL